MNVLAISGSLREASYNAGLLRAAQELAPAGMTVEIATLHGIPNYDGDVEAQGDPPEVASFKEAIREADGVLIATPEYNRGIPGGLKNAIDWVSRMKDQPFKDKPVALQSAAGGILGGSRMQYHLRQSLTSIDALLFGRPEVIVTFAPQKFDPNTLELKDQTAIDLIKQQLGGFEKFARKASGKA
jgi:chromate reductase, NAD(P)H dehydrogenase (quinone)